MDLFPAVFLHGVAGISLCLWVDEAAECDGAQQILLEYGAGICGTVGSFHIIDRALFHSPLTNLNRRLIPVPLEEREEIELIENRGNDDVSA